MRVVILGATGYTGQMLLRLLLGHPAVEAIHPVSFSSAGASIAHQDPGLSGEMGTPKLAGQYCSLDEVRDLIAGGTGVDAVFSALPHLQSAPALAQFTNTVIIDLSADFRIPDARRFQEAYRQPPPRPDLLSTAVYGLSEWNRDRLRTADLIANPGCYPTATLLPLLPLAQAGWIAGPVVVNALSGISGAGRKAADHLLYCRRTENLAAYAPGRSHRHWQEMHHYLAHFAAPAELWFTPHLVPVDRGLEVTTSLELKAGISETQVRDRLERHYESAPFVRWCSQLPETRQVRGTNRCDFTTHQEGQRLFLVSVIDNLYKGAAGQAVQNMNLRFGLDEWAGLNAHGELA